MSEKYEHVVDQVDDYLHEALPADQAEYVEAHCESCPICQAALTEARRRLEAVRAVPTVEASERLIQDTLQKIDDYEAPRRRFRRLTLRVGLPAMAASIVIVAGLHLHYATLSPSPYDLQVFGQTELLSGTPASVRVRLMNRDSAQAVSDAPVTIELFSRRTDHRVQLASFTTDAQGTARSQFRLPEWPDGDYELRIVARPAGEREEMVRPVKLKRSWKLMLSTDKPVYQPGQTILMRALALRRGDLKPVAGQAVTFSITDPKDNVIFKQSDVTSAYGITSAECPLATEIIEGPYRVVCQVDQTTSRTTIDVKKYVLPKFKIDVELDRPFYQPGQTVRGTVQAHYFFGKPVADADVEVKHRRWGAKTIETWTDRTGKATFEIALPEKRGGYGEGYGGGYGGGYRGRRGDRIEVSVTDSAGQSQHTTVSAIVTSHPLRVEVIPEGRTLVRDVANTIYLLVSYADGRPARVRLAVTHLQEEIMTDSQGVVSFVITPKSDVVKLTVRATDAKGLIGRRTATLRCGHGDLDFLVQTDRAVYDGGDTMQVIALGGGTEPLFLDFIKGGQTILTECVPMADGRGAYEFDLPAELFGTVELCAYRFAETGLPVRKTRVIYVRPADELAIKAALDRTEYRPDGRAKLTITLVDRQGHPTPGAISLAAVDEAVFSVLQDRPGMEQTFFTLEQELLKPIYAIYPWSPDFDRPKPTAVRNRFEQALFARTWRSATWNRMSSRGGYGGYGGGPRPPDADLDSLDRVGRRGKPLPDEVVAMLRGREHSLTATSYPEKVQRIQRERHRGVERAQYAWLVLCGLLACAAVAWTWFSHRDALMVFACVLASLVILVLVLLASLARSTTLVKTVGVEDKAAPTGREFARGPMLGALGYVGGGGYGGGGYGGGSTDEGLSRPPVRVRDWFPETLLWRPELITDDNGRVSLDVDLADSITTWRLTASAVAGDGRLGASQSSIRVFQPFFVDLNLPVAMTRGDEVAVPVVVYNYLDRPQTVELALEDAAWFERLDPTAKRIELKPAGVRSVAYRLRVTKVGQHELQVTARGEGVADAIKRKIEVVPDGQRVERVFNGTLQEPVQIALAVPADAIEGSVKAILKIYPSSFSQLVEGLDGIFRRPYGCFEQTSSTTYPNILALDYLRRIKKNAPNVEAKARQYIHLGYQRLLGFEIEGGGFDWFGRPPANRTLTAYGLMEFDDMARVHGVDPELIKRTRMWLLEQQDADGSWAPDGQRMEERVTSDGKLARLSTTAYIAWAVYGGSCDRSDASPSPTRQYLLEHRADDIADPYVLALVCNALCAITPDDPTVQPYVDRLEGLKRTSTDGSQAWWERSPDARTAFYGGGRSGNIETTALATLAMIHTRRYAGTTHAALGWLAGQKDASGTWHSTQATVLALKALVEGTGGPQAGGRERRVEIAWSDAETHTIALPADQGEVMRQIDLSDRLAVGEHELTLRDATGAPTGYQVAFRYHVPGEPAQKPAEPLAIRVEYDRSDLRVGDTIKATATITNTMPRPAPMVILDLPIPAGFQAVSGDWAKLVGSGTIARFQVTPRSVIVYLRQLSPDKPLTLRYRLEAAMPVKTNVPPARAYEYYDPDRQGTGTFTRLTVTQRI